MVWVAWSCHVFVQRSSHSTNRGIMNLKKETAFSKEISIVMTFPRELFWDRSRPPEVFLQKRVLKIGSKFTEEHLCRSVISIKLQSNFIEITLWHGCFPVNLLHIFRTPFYKNTYGGLLLFEIYFIDLIYGVIKR